MAAKLLVLVVTQAQLGREVLTVEAVLDKSGAIPAAVFLENGAAAYTVFIGIGAEDQAVLIVQRQVVLPVQRVAIGIEAVNIGAELVPGFFAVFAVAKLQSRVPVLIELSVDKAGNAADIEIAVKLLATDGKRVRVPAPERIVEFGLADVLQRRHSDFKVIAQRVAQVQA